ncbi:hypothetical protein CKAH01_18459 [Colletotrichum kahawae]|uniref:Uncharacterized protein n=1 Tax=Colletotrichum kahawae TaxID=34407 RepID=A0AAD9Y8R5_COLKA|nr:hypothetical protein CKAH01_18459 [Colletotrichum kahawae]
MTHIPMFTTSLPMLQSVSSAGGPLTVCAPVNNARRFVFGSQAHPTRHVKSSTSTSSFASIFASKRKRSAGNDFIDENAADVSHSKTSKKLKPSTELDARLVCPFFKNDLAQYQDCVKGAYQTWAHVKQHLRRKHCTKVDDGKRPVCDVSMVKSDEDGKNYDQVAPEGLDTLDGIGDTKMQLIEENTKARSMSDEERWDVAWEIIFPHVNPPTTRYAQNLIDEFVDYVLRGVPGPPRSFDTVLVDGNLDTSPAASTAVAIQFLDLLKRRQHVASRHRQDSRQCEDHGAALSSAFNTIDTDLAHLSNPGLISNNCIAFPDVDLAASILAGTADEHGHGIDEEEMTIHGLLSGQDMFEGLERGLEEY